MSEFNLPKGWIFAPIGALCDLINGRAFKQTEWREKGLPIIRIQNLNKAHAMFNYYDGELEEKHLVSYGDLLFAWSGTPGTSFGAHEWRGEKGALNQHIFKLVFDNKHIDKSFFLHSINFKLNELIGNANGGVGLRHVTKGVFESTLLEYPPLAEQQKIAQKLDELLAQVDTIKTRLDTIPNTLKRFRQSVLAAAVSGRLTEEWRGERKCAEWANEKIGKLTLKVGSGSTPKGGESAYKQEGIPLIRSMNVIFFGFKYQGLAFIDDKQAYDLRGSEVRSEDVLLNITGASIGRVTLAPKKLDGARVNQHVCIVRPNEKILSRFLCFYFSSPKMQEIIGGENYGVTRQALTKQQILDFEILLPSVEEQTEIVLRVEQLFAYADQIEQRVKDAQSRVNHLTQSILAKAFRGELTADWRAQNPELISGENSAAALLKRVKAERDAVVKPKRKSKQ